MIIDEMIVQGILSLKIYQNGSLRSYESTEVGGSILRKEELLIHNKRKHFYYKSNHPDMKYVHWYTSSRKEHNMVFPQGTTTDT